jgi:hypothetical protein
MKVENYFVVCSVLLVDYTGLKIKWLVDELLCTDVIGTPRLEVKFYLHNFDICGFEC